MSATPTLEGSRRVPNEVSALIIDNLHDDLLSLRNVALVSKVFAYLARIHIFRKVDLSYWVGENCFPRAQQFVALLRDPHTSPSITDLVRTLEVPVNCHFADVTFALQNLPFLNNIRITLPSSTHIQIIETKFGGSLRELRLVGLDLYCHEDAQVLQKMLASLTHLRTLAIGFCIAKTTLDTLILPKSLKFLSLQGITFNVIRAIGRGMTLQPLMLHAIFLELDNFHHFSNGVISHPELWAGLESQIPVVLVVGSIASLLKDPLAGQALKDRIDGLKVTQLVFSCKQSDVLALFFAKLIPVMPDSVQRICIDTDASSCSTFHSFHHTYWETFDAALCRRHNRGLLEHVRFRCTMRARPFDFLSAHKNGRMDRSILDDIQERLPESCRLGFIEFDRTTMFFEPTM